MKKSVALELTQIDQGIETLLSNAEDLVSEAKTLFFANAFARALFLAHSAKEEFLKSRDASGGSSEAASGGAACGLDKANVQAPRSRGKVISGAF
ncbi:AbiV family abortive infection protein [Alcaligenes faecalis]|uniref:AbiV family abortive infection protein n=1 Tax=Alcaligenes TaxID=507 RepID=UPI0035589557